MEDFKLLDYREKYFGRKAILSKDTRNNSADSVPKFLNKNHKNTLHCLEYQQEYKQDLFSIHILFTSGEKANLKFKMSLFYEQKTHLNDYVKDLFMNSNNDVSREKCQPIQR